MAKTTKKTKTQKTTKVKRITNEMLLQEIRVMGTAIDHIIAHLAKLDSVHIDKDRTQMMFDALKEARLPVSTRYFIDSLEQGFEEYGSLTDRQFDCLKRNYQKFIHGKPFKERY